MSNSVVIVGAGLAGLAAGLHLKRKGADVSIYEQSGHIGGRVVSQKLPGEGGATVDVGFQVLLTSYPELKHFIDLDALNLKSFHSGSVIVHRQEGEIKRYLLANPIKHPEEIFSGLFSNLLPITDKGLVLRLMAQVMFNSKVSQPMTTLQYLSAIGFSERIIELFWRPFLGGVFLDPDLSLPAEYFLFLVKCFASGEVAVPTHGMHEIPKQMAQNIGLKNIYLNQKVKEIHSQSITLENGQVVEASQVIVAYNPTQTAFRKVRNYYLSSPKSIETGRWLVLLPPQDGFKCNNVIAMSDVSEEYKNKNDHVISVSVLENSTATDEDVIDEMNQVFPEAGGFSLLKLFEVQKALPREYSTQGYLSSEGIYYCGDHLHSPSINGALKSGRLVAEAVLEKLKSQVVRSS